MQGCFVDGNIPEGRVGCSCDVCRSYYDGSPSRSIDEVNERCRNLFVDDIEADVADTYVSLLRFTNDQDLEKVRSEVILSTVDDKIIFESYFSDKFMVATALLFALVLLSFVIFAFAITIGEDAARIYSVSSVVISSLTTSSLTTSSATTWVGFGLCLSSFAYSMLGLGYLIGRRSNLNNKRCNFILDSCESKLKRYATIQKKAGFVLDKFHKVLQSRESDLKIAAAISNIIRRSPLSRLMIEHYSISLSHREIRSKLEAVNSEIANIRNDNETNTRKIYLLSKENESLSEENYILRSKWRRIITVT
ncbi:putative membrane protein [Candidatus Ichthyocystis hellenicum]|uniref:Putative membrane protein n=1 Tax=Candidatus Ichthyocystis hellenicum TaxID=1561003 RepID=A0A0S4M2V4_9BURK|nr:hypothetical protein [Candidatus Ichthyocystis hellenicum]CUT17552.1 putative membrane protein [Candidatus Ichthyocystis hellenicum]